jgi:predicted lactoylglutathione lyase
MTTPQAPAPSVTNAGSRPATPRKLFVSLPVSDLQRAITFYEALGFTFDPQATDAGATMMCIGEDAYAMLATRERFAALSPRSIADPRETISALLALSAGSRTEVDALVHQAVAAGGASGADQQDHGFMYEWSFYDLDGHGWGVFWMDPAAAAGG